IWKSTRMLRPATCDRSRVSVDARGHAWVAARAARDLASAISRGVAIATPSGRQVSATAGRGGKMRPGLHSVGVVESSLHQGAHAHFEHVSVEERVVLLRVESWRLGLAPRAACLHEQLSHHEEPQSDEEIPGTLRSASGLFRTAEDLVDVPQRILTGPPQTGFP